MDDQVQASQIDKQEFGDAIAALGCDAPREETDALFEKFDKDSSGLIDYRELQKEIHAADTRFQ